MDKKELKDAFKQYKPEMGVYAFICRSLNKAYIGYGQNLKGDINSVTFQLKTGSYMSNKTTDLLNDWNKFGEADFEITVLERLDYAKDESKTDYTDELKTLRDLCAERFKKFEFLQK